MTTQTRWRSFLRGTRVLTRSGFALGGLIASGCAVGPQTLTGRETAKGSTASGALPAQTASFPPEIQPTSATALATTVTLRGWLSIVWNAQPHFFITGDDGMTVEVLLDEQLTAPFGGPLALDRSRVVVTAVVSLEAREVFQALSIEREAGE